MPRAITTIAIASASRTVVAPTVASRFARRSVMTRGRRARREAWCAIVPRLSRERARRIEGVRSGVLERQPLDQGQDGRIRVARRLFLAVSTIRAVTPD